MRLLDKGEAPTGYEAKPWTGTCRPCDFWLRTMGMCTRHVTPSCDGLARIDENSVIFKRVAVSSQPPTPSAAQDPKSSAGGIDGAAVTFIPSAGQCAECSKNVPDKCRQLSFGAMEVIRKMPAHRIAVVRCTHFEK